MQLVIRANNNLSYLKNQQLRRFMVQEKASSTSLQEEVVLISKRLGNYLEEFAGPLLLFFVCFSHLIYFNNNDISLWFTTSALFGFLFTFAKEKPGLVLSGLLQAAFVIWVGLNEPFWLIPQLIFSFSIMASLGVCVLVLELAQTKQQASKIQQSDEKYNDKITTLSLAEMNPNMTTEDLQKNRIEQLERENDRLNKELEDFLTHNDDGTKGFRKVHEELKNINLQKEHLWQQLFDARQELTKLYHEKQVLEDVRRQLEVAENTIKELTEAKTSALNKFSEIQHLNQTLASEKDEFYQKYRHLETQISELSFENSHIKERFATLHGQVAHDREELEKALEIKTLLSKNQEKELITIKNENADYKTKLEDLEEKNRVLSKELEAKVAKYTDEFDKANLIQQTFLQKTQHLQQTLNEEKELREGEYKKIMSLEDEFLKKTENFEVELQAAIDEKNYYSLALIDAQKEKAKLLVEMSMLTANLEGSKEKSPKDHQYVQLRGQFEQKSKTLDETRKELFLCQERIEEYRKIIEEYELAPSDDYEMMKKDIIEWGKRFDDMEKSYEDELFQYQELISKLSYQLDIISKDASKASKSHALSQ